MKSSDVVDKRDESQRFLAKLCGEENRKTPARFHKPDSLTGVWTVCCKTKSSGFLCLKTWIDGRFPINLVRVSKLFRIRHQRSKLSFKKKNSINWNYFHFIFFENRVVLLQQNVFLAMKCNEEIFFIAKNINLATKYEFRH